MTPAVRRERAEYAWAVAWRKRRDGHLDASDWEACARRLWRPDTPHTSN